MNMKRVVGGWLAAAMLALLAGCAGYAGSNLIAGQSTEAQVRASMGQPAMVEHVGDETWLYYPRGEFARQTFVARIGPQGLLRGIDQRLSVANSKKIEIGKSTMHDVRVLLGPPHEVTRFPLIKRIAWEYWIFDNPTKRRLDVQFSYDGIAREVYVLLDPVYDKSGDFPGKD